MDGKQGDSKRIGNAIYGSKTWASVVRGSGDSKRGEDPPRIPTGGSRIPDKTTRNTVPPKNNAPRGPNKRGQDVRSAQNNSVKERLPSKTTKKFFTTMNNAFVCVKIAGKLKLRNIFMGRA